jgi:hypothetical protein
MKYMPKKKNKNNWTIIYDKSRDIVKL